MIELNVWALIFGGITSLCTVVGLFFIIRLQISQTKLTGIQSIKTVHEIAATDDSRTLAGMQALMAEYKDNMKLQAADIATLKLEVKQLHDEVVVLRADSRAKEMLINAKDDTIARLHIELGSAQNTIKMLQEENAVLKAART